MIQQGPVASLIQLRNAGSNTINYRFQEFDGSDWADIGESGDDTYDTLIEDEVKHIKLESGYPKVRLVGNASGGSTIEFSVTRYYARTDGGSIPMLSF